MKYIQTYNLFAPFSHERTVGTSPDFTIASEKRNRTHAETETVVEIHPYTLEAVHVKFQCLTLMEFSRGFY